jgi:hypothetical protein
MNPANRRPRRNDDRRSGGDGHGAGHEVACKEYRENKTVPSDRLRSTPAGLAANPERFAAGRRQSAGKACFDV